MTRATEIIIKPIIAIISDNFTSSIGRRKPFMLFGCFFYAFFMIILFYPPFQDSKTSYSLLKNAHLKKFIDKKINIEKYHNKMESGKFLN